MKLIIRIQKDFLNIELQWVPPESNMNQKAPQVKKKKVENHRRIESNLSYENETTSE